MKGPETHLKAPESNPFAARMQAVVVGYAPLRAKSVRSGMVRLLRQ